MRALSSWVNFVSAVFCSSSSTICADCRAARSWRSTLAAASAVVAACMVARRRAVGARVSLEYAARCSTAPRHPQPHPRRRSIPPVLTRFDPASTIPPGRLTPADERQYARPRWRAEGGARERSLSFAIVVFLLVFVPIHPSHLLG